MCIFKDDNNINYINFITRVKALDYNFNLVIKQSKN